MIAAIVDNTVLANFLDAGNKELLNKSRNIFSAFYIPEKILAEFLKVPAPYFASRNQFVDGVRLERGFYRLCTTFDQIIMGMLLTQKGVDPGEAEAIAQAVKRNITIFLTDDKKCKKYVTDNHPYIRCYGTLFLIAIFDLNKFLIHPKNAWLEIYSRHKFKYQDIEEAYLQAFSFVGITPEKKYIKKMCKSIFE